MKRVVIIFLFSLFNCSIFQLREHDGLWEYVKGKPGLQNAKDASNEPKNGKIFGERHPLYLWLRTPEIIFNPQGGLYYPDMYAKYNGKLYDTTDLSKVKEKKKREKILRYRSGYFVGMDEGVIDYTLQYRALIDSDGYLDLAIGRWIFLPIWIPFKLIANGNIFIYPIHDVIKTVMIPVAGVYYTVQAFEDEEAEE